MLFKPTALATVALCLVPSVLGRDRGGLRGRKPAAIKQRQEEAATARSLLEIRASSSSSSGSSNRRYYTNDTSRTSPSIIKSPKPGLTGRSEFFVESLPDVNFALSEMYSGLIPISYSNTSEALFFVFQPTVGEPVDEITIWLNGGPGCSSLEGFLQENGLYNWQPGTYEPVINSYSWVNLTNLLWCV